MKKYLLLTIASASITLAPLAAKTTEQFKTNNNKSKKIYVTTGFAMTGFIRGNKPSIENGFNFAIGYKISPKTSIEFDGNYIRPDEIHDSMVKSIIKEKLIKEHMRDIPNLKTNIINSANIKLDGLSNSIKTNTKGDLSTYGVLVNQCIYGGLHLYCGAYYKPTIAKMTITSKDYPNKYVSLSLSTAKVLPTFGIGYNSALSTDKPGLNFNAKLGIIYTGKIRFKTDSNINELKNSQVAKTLLDKLENHIENHINKNNPKITPLIKFGLTYLF